MIRQLRAEEWPEALSVIRPALGKFANQFHLPATIKICHDTSIAYCGPAGIAGVLLWLPVPDEPKFELPLVAVHPRAQRRGLGRAMVEHLVRHHGHGIDRLIADVPSGMYGSAEFFDGIGFRHSDSFANFLRFVCELPLDRAERLQDEAIRGEV